jgi:hypothetical protein
VGRLAIRLIRATKLVPKCPKVERLLRLRLTAMIINRVAFRF